MVNRYKFHSLFASNPTTGLLYPLYNTWINNVYYPAYLTIPKGYSFGGLDLYSLAGREIAAILNPDNSLTISGFY